VRYLGARPRTQREVERRLARAGVEPPTIAGTVERLARLGYLDDAAFVRWWVEQRDRRAPRGRRMLEAELRQRGVGRDVLEALRDELASPERGADDDTLPGSDEERAQTALAAHLRGRPLPTEPKALQRLGTFLMRRGFDPETVRSVLRAASDVDPD
jgi:regulatory protein